MKIEIKNDGDMFVLTNENLNNNNFVDLWYGTDEEITVPIDELYSAILAFKQLRDDRKEM